MAYNSQFPSHSNLQKILINLVDEIILYEKFVDFLLNISY